MDGLIRETITLWDLQVHTGLVACILPPAALLGLTLAGVDVIGWILDLLERRR